MLTSRARERNDATGDAIRADGDLEAKFAVSWRPTSTSQPAVQEEGAVTVTGTVPTQAQLSKMTL